MAKKAKTKAKPKATKKVVKKTAVKKSTKSKSASKKVASKASAAAKVKKKAASKVAGKASTVKKTAVDNKKIKKVAAPKASTKKAPESKKVKVEPKAKAVAEKVEKLAKAPKPEKAKEPKKSERAIATESSAPAKITIEQDIVITDAEGRVLCRVRECDQPSVVEGYCRYHYLLFWKKIQVRKKILSEGKLEKYIEELTSRYPTKYLDLIKKDLSTEAGFLHAIQELEIDDSSSDDEARDFDEERSFIEEVRGVSDGNERDDNEY